MATQSDVTQFLADDPPTVVNLAIKSHFEALGAKEKLYAHYLSVASFAGSRIVLRQTSEESEGIYNLIIELYKHCKGDWASLQHQSGLSSDELHQFLCYAAMFLGNLANFKSFGDSKFIPRLNQRQFKALATCSKKTLELFEKVGNTMYSTQNEAKMHLGYPDQGHVSTYYPNSPSITKEEITIVSSFCDGIGLLPENTRLTKTQQGNFELLIASAETHPSKSDRDVNHSEYSLIGKLAGKTLKIVFGDYSVEMGKISKALAKAKENAANATEEKMMTEYVKSFETGSLEAFKQSQRYWIQDKGPTVESDIGFIETYRDPHGIRGEWEGFVAMVNKERTKAFSKLVESAPSLIPRLPWSKDFEKDKFLTPDFTSLEVLTFAGSGIPAGINIPNYDDIRQTEGFKNVSLGNVLNAKAPNEPVPFLKDSDIDLFNKYRDSAFEVQVGLHELLGHGCGKLLQETAPNKYNFDVTNPPINPLTGKPVTSWYKPGQTWSGLFGSLAGPFEECRAECVAMYLCCDFDILQIFGHGNGEKDMDGEAGDLLYIAYLSMARAGLTSMEMWDPKSSKWGQAHSQARFSILQTFLSAGGDFVSLDYTKDDLSDLTIRLDRSKILSHGRPAVEKYLQELAIYKATADVTTGTKLFNDLTTVNEFWGTKVRGQVLEKKTPRKVFVQANTFLHGPHDEVILKEYPATLEGMIESFAEREYI